MRKIKLNLRETVIEVKSVTNSDITLKLTNTECGKIVYAKLTDKQIENLHSEIEDNSNCWKAPRITEISDVRVKYREYTKLGDEEKMSFKYHGGIYKITVVKMCNNIILSIGRDYEEAMTLSFDTMYHRSALREFYAKIKNVMFHYEF